MKSGPILAKSGPIIAKINLKVNNKFEGLPFLMTRLYKEAVMRKVYQCKCVKTDQYNTTEFRN